VNVGTKVEAIDEDGIIKYTGTYLGTGRPTAEVPIASSSREREHHAVQVNDKGDVVYLDVFFWTLREVRV